MINIEIISYITAGAVGYVFGDSPSRIRKFLWKTDLISFDNAKTQRNQIWESPVRIFTLNFDWVKEGVSDRLIELFHRAKGRYNSFLFLYERDNLCTVDDWAYTLTTGDTTTQLQKTYYKGDTEEWTEDKTKIVPSGTYAPTIKINGAAKVEGVDYTLDDLTGIITWTGYTPVTGHIVTADYKFYFEVMFDVDEYMDVEHQIDWWSVNGIQLVEVK